MSDHFNKSFWLGRIMRHISNQMPDAYWVDGERWNALFDAYEICERLDSESIK